MKGSLSCVAHLTHVVGTVIKVLSTVVTRPAKDALAFISCVMVDAGCPILTGIELLSAEGNFLFTELSCEASWTSARVRVQAIYTGGSILTLVAGTVVDINFTSTALKARWTVTAWEKIIKLRFSERSRNYILLSAELYLLVGRQLFYDLSEMSNCFLGKANPFKSSTYIYYNQKKQQSTGITAGSSYNLRISASLEHLAGTAIITGISITGINSVLALWSMEAC